MDATYFSGRITTPYSSMIYAGSILMLWERRFSNDNSEMSYKFEHKLVLLGY